MKIANPLIVSGSSGSIQTGTTLSLKKGNDGENSGMDISNMNVAINTSVYIPASGTISKSTKNVLKKEQKETVISSTQKPLSKGSSEVIAKKEENTRCYHYGFTSGSLAQEMISYACKISNYDKDFILTLNAENGSWDYKAQSRVIQRNGSYEPSYGMCQMHYGYQKNTVYEGLPRNRIFESRYLSDWKYQIETCFKAYKAGTPMYGYNVRFKSARGLVLIGDRKF